MKAGVVALALVGSAVAAPDYWPAPVSSNTPADPVKPTTSVGWPAKPEETSTTSTATWSTPSWGADPEEDCDDEEEDPVSWTKTGSWPAKATSSSSVGWPVKPVKGYTTTTTAAKPTWSAGSWGPGAVPSYFDPSYACCKTVVTVTVWAGSVPTTSSTPAAPVWSIPASPVVSSSSSSSPVWSDPVWSVPADPVWSIPAAPVVSSSSSPAAPVWSAPAAPAWSAPAAPVWSAPAAPATSSAAPSIGVITNGNKWGVTYTPYTPAGQCKTADEVDADIAKIASWGFTTVRLYATDCSGLTNVGASTKAHGLKIIVGVFIDSKGPGAAWSQVDDITTWGSAGNWAHVSGIVVGNEAIFNGYTSASDLAGLITKAKGAWTGAGYSGWVTTTEPVDVIQKWASTLSSVVDVAAANIQPFFTSSVSSSWAGSFVAGQLALIEAAFPGKTAYNLESGWPSAGSSNGAAVASPSDQKAAIDDIIAKAGDKSCIFSFEDDSWKEAGSFGVEKSFGVSDLFSSY